MNTTMSLSAKERHWLAQLTEARTRTLALANAGQLDVAELCRVAETEAELALALLPMPEEVAGHLQAAHAHAHPYLERLPQHDPTREVVADPIHSYTPRKVLRRVLDHALDHLNQIEQWLIWQQQGVVPTPTDGWADSATTLAEDLLPLTQADLNAWLWRIDLTIEMVAQRARRLSPEQLDWKPPTDGWSIRQALHHLASAEIFYTVWLDEALPGEPLARYTEANRRLEQQVYQVLNQPASKNMTFFEGETTTTLAQIIQEALAAEQSLLKQ